jgi:hypothetical protein
MPTGYSVVFILFLVKLVPCHLDCFEFSLGGSCGIVAEFIQISHPLAQIGKPHIERIETRMILGENLGNLLGLIPFESHLWGVSLPGVESNPYARARRGLFPVRRTTLNA